MNSLFGRSFLPLKNLPALTAFALGMLVACPGHAQVLAGPSGVLPNAAHTAAGQFLFWDAGGVNYNAFKSPDSLTSGTKELWVLPPGDGSTADPCWGWQSSSTSGGITTSILGWFPCMTLNTAQTVTGSKTFTVDILASGTPNIGSAGNAFNTAWITEGIFQTVAVSASGSSFLIGIDTSDSNLAITNSARTPIIEFNTGGPQTIAWAPIVPETTNTYSLGGPSLLWSHGYFNALTVTTCMGCVPSDMMTTDTAQTVTASKTLTTDLLASGTPNIGSAGNAFNDAWITEGIFQTVAVSASGSSFLIGIDTSDSNLAITNSARTPIIEFNTSGPQTIAWAPIVPETTNTYSLGGPSLLWSHGYFNALTVTTCMGCVPSDMMTTDTTQTVSGSKTFSTGQSFTSGINMSTTTGVNSTLFTGSGGNFYTRLISASSGVSCSGVPDGWLALAADGYIVACGSGVRSRAALTVY